MSKLRFSHFALVLFGTSLLHTLAFAQYNPGLVATRAVPVGGNPLGVATADLNHDGIPDAVIADGSTSTVDSGGVRQTTIHGIAVLLGTSGGGYRPPAHFSTIDSASFVAISDINGDGNPDVITASDDPNLLVPGASPGGSVEVLRGRGDGTFSAPTKYTFPGRYAVAVYPGDLDNDGHIDLVVALTFAAYDGHSTVYMLNNGDGTFRKGFDTVGPMPVAVADFNHDGKLDVAALYYHSGTPNSFGVLYGNGGESFGGVSNMVGVPPIDQYFGVTVADFNGDGYLDVAYIADDSSVVTVLLNSAAGTFAAKTFILPANGIMAGICAGDFNHDGQIDLATIDSQAQLFEWYGQGDGTFSTPVQFAVLGTGVLMIEVLTATDLNNDGILDIATVGPAGSFIPIFGKGAGAFNAVPVINLGAEVVSVDSVTADFNGDGIPDIAVLRWDLATNTVTAQILLGIGNGRFKMSRSFLVGMVGRAMAAGDVNRDGKIDLVVRNDPEAYGLPVLAILLGNGDATFRTPTTTGGAIPHVTLDNLPQQTTPVYIADVNNDGKPDAVSYAGVNLGRGDGTFADAIPLPDSNYLLALGDFNKDGKIDLVTLTDIINPPEVNLYLGSGNGHFAAGTYSVTLSFGDLEHNYLAVGRFTKDGNLGVAAGSSRQFFPDHTVAQNGAFSLLAGNGDGTLKDQVAYQLPDELWKLAVADLDGDGVDDILAFQTAEVSLFKNMGDGTLQPPVQFGVSGVMDLYNAGNLPVADFNRDGALDVAGLPRSTEDILMNSRGTSVALSASPTSAKAGQPIQLKCTVTASFHFSGALFGRVTFYDGSTALGTADLVKGIATLNLSTLSAGTHALSATFLGNGNYNAHHSSVVNVVITP
jgi:Bacterial Ig-like domain (group 3)/FG-GAP-like repeat